MEQRYSKEAKAQGISRSKHVVNCLLKYETLTKVKKKTTTPKPTAPNDCRNRGKGNYCCKFPMECHAPQSEAETCEGYHKS